MSMCEQGNADLAAVLFFFFFLGTWGGNLEDLTSEDWNEDVRQHLFNNLKGICNASVRGLTQSLFTDIALNLHWPA